MKKKLILGALIVTSAGALVLGAPRSYAQEMETEKTIVQRLAQRFGANIEDVQKVFDEDRVARQNEMKQKMEQRLSTLVREGKITEAQKTKIIEKQTELFASKQKLLGSLQDKTPQERRALKQSHQEELKKWAQENGIELRYLMGGVGKGHMKMTKAVRMTE